MILREQLTTIPLVIYNPLNIYLLSNFGFMFPAIICKAKENQQVAFIIYFRTI
jgi:hypothetical protein